MGNRTDRIRRATVELLGDAARLESWRAALRRSLPLRSLDDLIGSPPRILPTLRELASAAHVGKRTLCRKFKHSIGMTPIELLTVVRLVRAASEVRESGDQLKRIADREGFSGSSALNHHFGRYLDASPSAIRRAVPPGPPAHPTARPTPADA